MALVEMKMSLKMCRKVEENIVNWARFLIASAKPATSSRASGTEGRWSTVNRDQRAHGGREIMDRTSLLNFLRHRARATHGVDGDGSLGGLGRNPLARKQ